MRSMWLLAALAAVGCGKDEGKTPGGKDSGPVTAGDDSGTIPGDDTGTTDVCEGIVTQLSPGTGATEIYYRDPLQATFEGKGTGATFTLVDAAGNPASFTTTWSEGDVKASLDVVLAPSTLYTFTATLCDVETSTSFTTSASGTALSMAPEDLVGKTYQFRLSDAEITEPAFLNILADTYLIVPLLFGVYEADATMIHWVGALGYQNNDGTYEPLDDTRWDFPAADFTGSPYFAAQAEYITIAYSTFDIPIEQFAIEATLSSDAERIEHGRATGFADSRSMGELVFQPDNPAAICEFAVAAGVDCVPCDDGEPYCLYIVAENITAYLAEGLALDLDP